MDPRGVLKLATERAEVAGYKCFSGVEYEVRLDFFFQFHLSPRLQYFNFKGEFGPSALFQSLHLNRNARLRFGEKVHKFGTFDTWKSVYSITTCYRGCYLI